jgi:hypothetical protein
MPKRKKVVLPEQSTLDQGRHSSLDHTANAQNAMTHANAIRNHIHEVCQSCKDRNHAIAVSNGITPNEGTV